jgi:nucleotide-binding universal stress UspA family protein
VTVPAALAGRHPVQGSFRAGLDPTIPDVGRSPDRNGCPAGWPAVRPAARIEIAVDSPTLAAASNRSPLNAGGFRRILVGFDGTNRAFDALALAQCLLDPDDGLLILGRVESQRAFKWPRRRAAAAAAQGRVAARAQIAAGVAAIECVRSARSVARGLTELAEAQRADLVVIGSRAAAPSGRTSPGRTGLRLLQGVHCAVSIAPAGWRDTGRFRHIGVAYDGSPDADAALASGYGLAVCHGAAMSLFYVNVAGVGSLTGLSDRELDQALQRSRLEAHERLDAAADAAPPGVNPRTVLLHGDPAREIATAADGIIDILLTGSRGHGAMQRALTGSVSQALVLASTTYPVVVIRHADDASPERQRSVREREAEPHDRQRDQEHERLDRVSAGTAAVPDDQSGDGHDQPELDLKRRGVPARVAERERAAGGDQHGKGGQ